MKSIKLQVFIYAAALIITGCSGNSPVNKNQAKDGYSVEVSTEIPAAKGLSDGEVTSVEINAFNGSGTWVGGGSLTRNNTTNWKGTISVSESGLITFNASAYNATGGNIYNGTGSLTLPADGFQLTISVASVSGAAITDLSGTWDISLIYSDGQWDSKLILTDDGNTVSATYGELALYAESISITKTKTTISFNIHFFINGEVHFTLTGTGTINAGESIEFGKFYETDYDSLTDTANHINSTRDPLAATDFYDFRMKRISTSTKIPSYIVPPASITGTCNLTEWSEVPIMFTDATGDNAESGTDIQWIKTAVNAYGTKMSVLAKINGDLFPHREYLLEFPYAEKEITFYTVPATIFFVLANTSMTSTITLPAATYYFGITKTDGTGTTTTQIPVPLSGTITYNDLVSSINLALDNTPDLNLTAMSFTLGTTSLLFITADLMSTTSIQLSAGTAGTDLFTTGLGLTVVPTDPCYSSLAFKSNNNVYATGAYNGQYLEISFDLLQLNLSSVISDLVFKSGLRGADDPDDNAVFFGHVILPKGWVTVFEDDFNRTTGLGSDWITSFGSISILDNELEITNGADYFGMVYYKNPVADPIIKISYKIRGSALTSYPAGAFARVNENAEGYYASLNGSGYTIEKQYLADEEIKTINLLSDSYSMEADANYKCEFMFNNDNPGFSITASNGTGKGTGTSVTDSDFTTGIIGLFHGYTADPIYIDDFKIQSYE